MDRLKIIGGNKLNGKLRISSAKNAVLPILCASLLVDGEVEILEFPNFLDCETMIRILKKFNADFRVENQSIKLDLKNLKFCAVETELAEKLRSSFFCFGSILARFGKAVFAYPGGCKIGARPIDLHLKAFKELGIKIIEKHGYIYAERGEYSGGTVFLEFPSVGATENLIMLATTLKGVTIIKNPAKEPEIIDLQNFLNNAGAKIIGAGSDEITIIGTGKLLHSIKFCPMGDRIIAGTYAIATSMTGGEVTLTNINPQYLQDVILKLEKAGAIIFERKNEIIISNNKRLKSIPIIETMPYPYFPTDLQPQMTALQSISEGNSVIIENIFESRLGYVSQLIKMGAKVRVRNNFAFVEGVSELFGAEVFAPDLRAGAGLVIAGLVAKGYTTINNVEVIDRGYESIEKDLMKIGANITREKID